MRPSLAAFLVATFAAGAARADFVIGVTGEPIVEVGHTIQVVLRRDHAVLEVERVVRNDGEAADAARISITLPHEWTAIGLRGGSLVEASQGAELFETAVPKAVGGRGSAALLSWQSAGHLLLRASPVPTGKERRYGYAVIAPMTYSGGKYRLAIPQGVMGTEDAPPRIAVRALGGKAARSDGAELGPFELAADVEVTQEVPFDDLMAGELASVPLAKEKVLAGFHLDVAPRLEEVPSGARIVVVVDRSRSIGADARAAELAAASAYLSHFDEESRAAIVSFHREVEDVTKGFVTMADARAALDNAKLEPRNGSELGLALDRAAELLASAPERAPRRVVLLTDLLTRAALTPDTVKAVLPRGTILHVATVRKGAAGLFRDDENAWAELPRGTGGVLWHATSSVGDDDEAFRRSVFEEWARAKRIDHVKVRAPGMQDIEVGCIDEGEGIERHFLSAKNVTHLTVTGEVWSRPITRSFEPSEAYGKRRAALAFGSGLLDADPAIDEKAKARLARFAGAVTPYTSYLAVTPGAREVFEERFGFGTSQGGGSFGGTSCVGYGTGSGTASVPVEGLLRAALEPLARSCGIGAGAAEVSIETTLAEIVSVSIRVDGDAGGKAAACLTDAAWAIALPETAQARHAALTLKL